MKPYNRGFSLIELLIVISIILIIAAIAIPNLLRSRIAANQASAVQSCRVINSAEIVYSSTYSQGYAPSLTALAPPPNGTDTTSSAAGLIDNVLAAGVKSGYAFTYTPTMPDGQNFYQGYTLNANPSQVGLSGNNYYFTDHSYVIRQNDVQSASSSDSPIGD